MSLFPTEEEQIAYIDTAESVNDTPSAFSMFISQNDIDHILRAGGNADDARMKIAAEFSKQKPIEDRAAFLKNLYYGGNGLITGNSRFSAWYGDDGIHIAKGDAARYLRSAQLISWTDAAERIDELLDSGTFATNLEVMEVHIYRYVTESTFDAYLWQTVENKQKFISQIMTSKSPVRSCEDVDETALSYAEIKALCAGDERIKEKMDLDVDVARLKLMKASHQSQQYKLEDSLLKKFPEEIEKSKGFISGLEADMKTLAAHPHPEDGFAGMTVKNDNLTDKDNAGAALLEAFKDVQGMEPVPIGTYRGFQMSLTLEDFGRDYVLTLKGQMTHRVTLGKDARGNLTRIDNALNAMPDRLQNVRNTLDAVTAQMEAAKAELGKRGKHVTFMRDSQPQNIRLRSLGEGYSEEELRAVILGTRVHTPRRKKRYPSKVSRPTLISQIEAKIGSGKGAAYDQKLKVVKLKSMAETLLFIQKHDFADFDALADYADAASARTKELTAKIKAAESRMAEIAVLKAHIINYAKTRDIYTAYRKAGYSKKYYDAHESDIIIHKAAKKAFDDLALKKLPTVKSLQAEYSDLLVHKKLDYAELSKARDEAKQLQIYKANAEMLLRTDTEEQRQTRERQQEK